MRIYENMGSGRWFLASCNFILAIIAVGMGVGHPQSLRDLRGLNLFIVPMDMFVAVSIYHCIKNYVLECDFKIGLVNVIVFLIYIAIPTVAFIESVKSLILIWHGIVPTLQYLDLYNEPVYFSNSEFHIWPIFLAYFIALLYYTSILLIQFLTFFRFKSER